MNLSYCWICRVAPGSYWLNANKGHFFIFRLPVVIPTEEYAGQLVSNRTFPAPSLFFVDFRGYWNRYVIVVENSPLRCLSMS